MPAAAPSSQTTLVVLLGASEWPYSPDFPPSQAFTNVARRLKEYFLDPQTFGLPSVNLLDLFDSDQSADDLDREIGQFLDQRISRMREIGFAARDLVVYFVGHGGFADSDVEYYLAIRRTRAENPTASGIRIVSLAHTFKEKARYLRRIVILDCCFAAAAFRAFQATPAQAAITQTLEAFKVPGKGEGIPGRGTSLLCSSRHNRPSLLLPDGSATMFSKALLEALATGNPYRQGPLSLQDVASLAEDVLRAMAVGDAPRPEVHSPDQSEGDIANLPFFPNAAERAARASANVQTSPVAEKPPQPIHGQPSQARSNPPSLQTQQQPYPSKAGPEPAPSNTAPAPNQSPSSPHTVFVSETSSPPTPPAPERIPGTPRNKWKTRVTGRTLLRTVVALVVLIASVVGLFALGTYQTTLSATHATATASRSTMLALQATGTAEVGTQATVSAQHTATVTFTNPYDEPTLKTLVLNDRLNENSDSRWDETSGKCSFTPQGYHVTDQAQAPTPQMCIARTTTNFSDLIFQVQMNILKGSGGIVFRSMGSAAYYFRIDRNGYYALFECAGVETSCTSPIINTFSSYINTVPNQLNLIAVVAIGDHIKLYINMVNVHPPFFDNRAVGGQIGVVADINSEVVFSNAEVWSS